MENPTKIMINLTTRTKLTPAFQKEALTSLSKYLGREIDLTEVNYLIDEKIIAGVKIEVDSEIIDLTLNNRLEKIIEVLNSY